MKTKRKILSVLVALCMLIGTMPPIAMAAPAADGEPDLSDDGYYEIATADELYWFADKVNNSGNTAINGRLTADIVINENVLTAEGELNGDGSDFKVWTPIGNISLKYKGIFDGQNHTVSGVYFNDEKDYAGLFGYADTNAQIKKVGVIGSYIKGRNYVGGVCGDNYGTVENCYNTRAVSGSNKYVGGVCGNNSGTITNCYNTGTVTGNQYVGGVCGNKSGGTIINCYNTGAVSGNYYVGGMCGRNYGTIENCYYLEGSTAQGIGSGTGEATAKTAEQLKSGEVCYLLNGSTSDGAPVWRQNIEKYAEPADAFPVLDQTHAVVKFDRTSYYNDCNNDCTHIKYDNGFCTACGAYQPAVLNGNIYEIGNAGQLYWFADKVNSGNKAINGRLTADIVINENVLNEAGELNGGSNFRVWTPIGNDENRYAGVFDGQNHTVSGLYFNDDTKNYVGLFGYTDTKAQIKNVGVIDSYIKGKDYVGGVCGYKSGGTITNCYNAGAVSGNDYIGGVCGAFDGVGLSIIGSCYNTGTVSGNSFVGGVCGSNSGTITSCYYLNTAYNGGIGGADVAGSAEVKTAAQFKSGEVCYLLNADQTNPVFKQTVATDNFPSFTGSTLYAVTFTDYAGTNANASVYGNEGGAVTIPAQYNTGYAFKDSAGKFVTPITVFGTENVTYTAIPAPTYTVTLPESTTLDGTNVDDTSGDYVKTGFDVSATAKWLKGNGKTLTVSVESANGYQMKANGAGTGVPYAYTAGTTTFTADNKTVLTLTDNNETKTASGTLRVKKADVIYAGTFTDILTFTISLK